MTLVSIGQNVNQNGFGLMVPQYDHFDDSMTVCTRFVTIIQQCNRFLLHPRCMSQPIESLILATLASEQPQQINIVLKVPYYHSHKNDCTSQPSTMIYRLSRQTEILNVTKYKRSTFKACQII